MQFQFSFNGTAQDPTLTFSATDNGQPMSFAPVPLRAAAWLLLSGLGGLGLFARKRAA